MADSWLQRANAPTAFQYLNEKGVGLDGLVYYVGGYNGAYTDTVRAYDPAANSYAAKAVCPVTPVRGAADAVNGKIIMVRGSSSGSTVYSYDPVANAWTAKASLPGSARHDFGGCGLGDYFYTFGGSAGGTDVYQYDALANTWAAKAAMPRARTWPTAKPLDGIIYLAAGSEPTTEFDSYDPTTDAWTAKAPLLRSYQSGPIGAAVGGRLFVGMGSNLPKTLDSYEPGSNAWTNRATNPGGGQHNAGAGIVGGKVYVAFGERSAAAVAETWEYDPPAPLAPTPVPTTITLLPATATKLPGDQHTVTANVKDQDGLNMSGVRVRFAVTGANPGSGDGLTDTNGNVDFTYIAANGGLDTITAYADSNDNGVRDTGEPQTTATLEVTVVGAAPASGAFDFPGGTPVHMILAPGGAADWPIVSDFRWVERASGGVVSCDGRITSDRFDENPDVYVPGAQWYVIAKETGNVMGIFELKEPVSAGGAVDLLGDGPAMLAEEPVERLLYLNDRYDSWISASGDPHNYNSNKKIRVVIGRNDIVFASTKGEDFNGAEQAGVLFPAVGDRITEIAFTIDKSEDDAGWEFVLYGTNIEQGGNGAALTELTAWGLGVGNPDGTEIVYTVGGDFDLIRLSLRRNAALAGAPAFEARPLNLRVNGRITGSDFSPSDVVRDVFAELGVSDVRVQDTDIEMGHADFVKGNYRAALDRAAQVAGWRWLIYVEGNRLIGDFGPYDTRTWTVLDPEFPHDLQSQERYDIAAVGFTTKDGIAKTVRAQADPNPLRTKRVAPVVDIGRAKQGVAEQRAEDLADYLVTKRYAGTMRFFRVGDEMGNFRAANDVHAGDMLYIPSLRVALRISELNKSTVVADATFPSEERA